MSRKQPPFTQAEALRFMVTRAGYVRRVLRSFGLSEPDIDDGQQEVFVSAVNAARNGRFRFRHPYAAIAWLRVTASRVAFAQFARRARVVFVLDWTELEEPYPSAEGPSIARDLVAVFRASTSPRNWRVWVAFAEGMKLHEIAKREGMPISTVWTRIMLAKRDFARVIRRERARERRGRR